MDKARELFREYKTRCISEFSLHHTGINDIKLVLNSKMRSTIGRANYKTFELQLNERLLRDHPEEIEATIVHELAHFVAYIKYDHRGHGKPWKNVMKTLGFSPDRCHDLDTSKYSRTHKPVAFAKCGCRDSIPIKSRRYNKMIQGFKYKCRKCKERLKLKDHRTITVY